MTRLVSRALDLGLALLLPVVLFALWWTISADSTSIFFPPLEEILEAFKDLWLWSHFSSDLIPSVRRMLTGFLIAVVAGVTLGALLGRNPLLARAANPLIQFGRSIPATALIPVGLILLGIGDTMKVVLIAFVCLFPVLLNTIDGVKSLDPVLEEVARSFRLRRRQRILALQLPAAAPRIFSGMRIALGLAFIMMIVTEMVGATNGIGYETLNAQVTFHIPDMWAGMVLLALLGAAFNIGFVLVERRVLRWRYLGSER